MTPIHFRPGEIVNYAMVKMAKHGMGPRGPEDCRPVRHRAQVVTQGHGPGPHNVLLRFGNGALVSTTWAHCRRNKA